MDFPTNLNFGKRAMEMLNGIAEFGKSEDGETRLLYSQEWLGAQNYIKNCLESEGLEAYFDDIGNLFGRLEGTECKNEVILTGSHIDTVKNGGILDGQYGIVAGVIAMD